MTNEDIAFQWWNEELTLAQRKWFFNKHKQNGVYIVGTTAGIAPSHKDIVENELKRIAVIVYELFHSGEHLKIVQ